VGRGRGATGTSALATTTAFVALAAFAGAAVVGADFVVEAVGRVAR
jgi:hypothetical protein